jgi:acyl-CoA synthetase (AMP-forming)/AMP-acid ligase II
LALRFDTPASVGKVIFPISTSSDSSELEHLLRACTPATFGSGGKDILDETYRKAGKLDRANFSVDFHPHDYGILDAIAQTLLPSMYRLDRNEGREEHWGVKAELYKLNVGERYPAKRDGEWTW